MSEQGVIRIHNKNYKTVALRISEFRNDFPSMSLETDIISNADLVIIKAWVSDESGRVLATGYAEEVRGSTNINKTSALENCETSAIGRALACFGLGGEEYASANEVSDAIIKQAQMAAVEKVLMHQKKVREYFENISYIKDTIFSDDEKTTFDKWFDIPLEDRRILFLAPSKGGIFTTKERNELAGDRFKKEHSRRCDEGLEKPQTVEDYENGK